MLFRSDQYMSLDFFPLSNKSKLEIDVDATFSNSALATLTGALFQDSTANALRAKTAGYIPSGGATLNNYFKHIMNTNVNANTLTTFKVRAGGNVAGTTYFNGNGSGLFNGTCFSSIVIKEFI